MPQLAQFVYDMYTDNVRAAELQARVFTIYTVYSFDCHVVS